MRVGILGGTFDPIHCDHLIMAEEASKALSLSEVVFVPAGKPWMKEGRGITPAKVRLQMVRLAIAASPLFRVSTIEINRPGATYTVDTLEELRKEWGPATEVHFIIGMDALIEMPRWKEQKRIMDLCNLVIFTRTEHTKEVSEAVLAQLPGLRERMRVIDGSTQGISSTDIRRRVSKGMSIRNHAPRLVEQFIVERGLYKDSELA